MVKKIYIRGLLSATLIMTGACTDDLINLVSESTLTTTSFFNTSKDMDLAVLGIYSNYQSQIQYYQLMELPGDNVYLGKWQTSPPLNELENLTVTSTNSTITSFWQGSYNGIFRSNSVLYNIDNPGDYKASEKDQFTGEAKFMRALNYFNLVRLFGGVPLVTTLLSIEESKKVPRATEDEVYTLIIEDLKDAISKLPLQANIARGRASKAAAVALLGKVYVYRKDWNNARTYLEQLFSEFSYSLFSDFSKVIKTENNSELIFVMKFIESTNGQSLTDNYTPFTGIYGGATAGGNLNPCWGLHKLFQAGDKRKAGTITEMWKAYKAGAGDPEVWAPYVNKYLVTHTYSVGCGLDLPVIRLADMILLYAETLYELGQTDPALIQLNKIRERAFGDSSHNYTLADIPDKTAFTDTLFLERRLELAFENERWFDLVRSGKYMTAMAYDETYYNDATQTPTVVTRTMKAYMKYFPIPLSEIELSDPGVLVQNEGY